MAVSDLPGDVCAACPSPEVIARIEAEATDTRWDEDVMVPSIEHHNRCRDVRVLLGVRAHLIQQRDTWREQAEKVADDLKDWQDIAPPELRTPGLFRMYVNGLEHGSQTEKEVLADVATWIENYPLSDRADTRDAWRQLLARIRAVLA